MWLFIYIILPIVAAWLISDYKLKPKTVKRKLLYAFGIPSVMVIVLTPILALFFMLAEIELLDNRLSGFPAYAGYMVPNLMIVAFVMTITMLIVIKVRK